MHLCITTNYGLPAFLPECVVQLRQYHNYFVARTQKEEMWPGVLWDRTHGRAVGLISWATSFQLRVSSLPHPHSSYKWRQRLADRLMSVAAYLRPEWSIRVCTRAWKACCSAGDMPWQEAGPSVGTAATIGEHAASVCLASLTGVLQRGVGKCSGNLLRVLALIQHFFQICTKNTLLKTRKQIR